MSLPVNEPPLGFIPADTAPLETKKLDHALLGGAAWTVGAKWLTQLISWPSVLITASLLSRADYGLVEMAGFYFIVTNVLAEFGIGMAVLQMRELDRSVTAQLNSVSVVTGLLAFLGSLITAPFIAAFFHAPALQNLVIVASATFILISLEAIPMALLQRDMDYRRLSIAESAQGIVTACVSVACAYSGMGYWSLIAGPMSGRAANIALIIFWRPTPFAWIRLREVRVPLRFGMELCAQRLAATFNQMSDVVVIGRTMGASPLGAYRLASNLATTPSEKIGTMIMRVTGPLFARVQHDRELMIRYLLIFTETLAMTAFPLLFGLAAVAQQAVDLLLPPEWASAGPPLRWLAVFMALRTPYYLCGQILTTLRLSRFGMWASILNVAIMPIAFYLVSARGIEAVAASWLILSPVTILPVVVRVLRRTGCSTTQYLNAFLPACVGCAAMLSAIFLLRTRMTLHGWPGLATEITFGGIVYCAVLWGIFRGRVMRFVRYFADVRNKGAAAAAQTA